MGARPAELQISQIGLEASLGAGATTFREPVSFSIVPAGKTDRKSRRPTGYLFPTAHKVTRERTEGKVEGDGSYYELWYPLASIFNKPATGSFPTGVTAGAYKHYFRPKGKSADVLQSFHIKHGDGTDNEEIKGVVFTEFGYVIDLEGFKWTGAIVGQAINGSGVSLATGGSKLASLSDVPAENLDVTVTIDGSTVDIVHKIEFKFGDRTKPVYTVKKASNGTMVAQVVTAPSTSLKLTMAADSFAKGYLTQMRNSTVCDVRVWADGPAITGSTPSTNHLFDHHFRGVPNELGELKNSEGVYAIEWEFLPQYESGIDSCTDIAIINSKQDYTN